MSSARPARHAPDASAQPELSRLEPPGRRTGNWRLAAVLLTIGLGAVIVAGRLGMEEPRASAPSPPASPLAVGSPQPSLGPTPVETALPTARPTLPPATDALPEVARYPDGLPTSLGGEKVHRLDAALSRATNRAVLVGGWYVGPGCLWPGRCVRQLADDPATLAFGGRTVALAGLDANEPGPFVLRVSRNDDCATSDEPECYPVFNVLEVAWSGDLFTRAGPIKPGPLLSALKFAFADLRAEPFRDLARCPVEWPPQTYRSVTGGPRMTVVFPTTEDRLASEQAVRGNWPQPASYPGAQCLDQFMDQGEPAGWIAEDNVMVWVSQDPATLALARAALLDARSQSKPSGTAVARPVTVWGALRALRGWEADIEALPPHHKLVWGPGLGPEGELVVAESYALSDPLIRLLLVFPEPAERRRYQRDVNPADVVILDGFPPSQEALAASLIEVRESGARWLGYRNVLLQVGGPAEFDDDLRGYLRRALN